MVRSVPVIQVKACVLLCRQVHRLPEAGKPYWYAKDDDRPRRDIHRHVPDIHERCAQDERQSDCRRNASALASREVEDGLLLVITHVRMYRHLDHQYGQVCASAMNPPDTTTMIAPPSNWPSPEFIDIP